MNYLFSIFISFSLGTVVSGAVFSFIAMIGIVPRLAHKTRTTKYVKLYEMMIAAGGIFGALTLYINFSFFLPPILVSLLSLCAGIFLGVLAVSLTEVLDVIPILMRRVNLAYGLVYIVFALAIGKFVGSLIFIFVGEIFTLG